MARSDDADDPQSEAAPTTPGSYINIFLFELAPPQFLILDGGKRKSDEEENGKKQPIGVEILMPVGSFQGSLGQRSSVGMIFIGRAGVADCRTGLDKRGSSRLNMPTNPPEEALTCINYLVLASESIASIYTSTPIL